MSHIFHIGAVRETVADALTESDIIIVGNEPKNIATMKKTANRIYMRFEYLRSSNKWDLSLTKDQKVYILGARRVTGLKGTNE